MKAIVLDQPEQFHQRDIAEPAAPAPGEALVRTHRVGICGTDISGYLGRMPFFSYPRIPGHELGVEVLAVGEGVTYLAEGDRCSVEPYMNCGECFACRRARPNCCANLRVLGVMMDGGLRERFTLRADKLHRSKTLAMEQLALVETLAIGCHAADRAAPQPDENVLVIGAGPIGLSTIEFVKLSGARIIALDLSDRRLDFCKQNMGVDHTVLGGENTLQELQDLTGGDLPSVVIDATGSAASMSNALHYVAPTGRLIYVGITTDDITFPHPMLHKPEMALLASRNALPGDFARIISLIEQGRIDTRPWITHRTSFDEMIGNFPSYTRPETGVVKAVVEMN